MEPQPRRSRRNPSVGPVSRGDPPEQERPRGWAKGEWWEWLAIFFAIAALWPKILRWQGVTWDLVLWAALILMIVVFVRRTRRMRRSWKAK